MKQKTSQATDSPTPAEPLRPLVDEFVGDIRRRARAVECLLKPRRPPWSFDLELLPVDDAERLVAIKREVERTFNTIFADRPRAHPNCGSGPTTTRATAGHRGVGKSSQSAA